MERLVAFTLLFFTLNAVVKPQSQKFLGDWSAHASTYPNDTLNLVTLGLINGKKYFFANQEASWFEANYFCNAHGMDLVSIETQHENDLILEHLTKLGLPNDFAIWISGHKIGTSSWLWVNGEFIIFSDWDIGEPAQPKTDFCMCIYNMKWYDLNCDWRGGAGTPGGFICEERETMKGSNIVIAETRNTYPTDLLNMVTLDPTTGKQYLFANVSSTWFDASYFCNAHGMDLVTIETQQENDLIMAHIESLGMTRTMGYWTSAHKIGRSTWLWINGENVIFSDWASGEPSNPTTEHCMHIYNGSWYDKSCEWIGDAVGKAAFICETRELSSGSGTEIRAADYYPADMMNLVTLGPGDGKRYLAADQPTNWFEASYFCNIHGMDLAIIETHEENEAIMNHLATLGLDTYDFTLTSGHKIGRTTYLWINGEFMLYSDWAPGAPSQEATENCLIIWRNDWYDIPCNNTVSYFMCEERIVSPNYNE